MAALQCELCGGGLVGKPGGVFECDSCGMEYSTEWTRAKIQEIRGTVKVEGGINRDALLKRGFLALTDRDWLNALSFFDQALNTDAECADAYLGRALALARIPGTEFLDGCENLARTAFAPSRDFYRAMEFATEGQRSRLQALLDRLERDRQRKEQEDILQARLQQQEAEERRRQEDEARKKAAEDRSRHIAGNLDTLRKVRQWIAPVQCLLQASEEALSAIDADSNAWVFSERSLYRRTAAKGIAQISSCDKNLVFLMAHGQPTAIEHAPFHQVCRDVLAISAADRFTAALTRDHTVKLLTPAIFKSSSQIEKWQNVAGISAYGNVLAAWRADGTALSIFVHPERGDDDNAIQVSHWRDLVQIVAWKNGILGLCSDGTVLSTNPKIQAQVESWLDVVAIDAGSSSVIGLRCDGTVISANKYENTHISQWRNVAAIAAGYHGIYGLRTDGRILSTAVNKEVAGLRLFKNLNQARCKLQLNQLKMQRQQLGIFGSKQTRKDLDAQIAALEAALQTL